MITSNEVDDELEEEIREEMSKYGQVSKVHIHKVCMILAQSPSHILYFLVFSGMSEWF